MRQENLTTIKGGLNRLRTKGAALKDSLFELLNAYVTVEKTIRPRPGTILDATLPSGTFGLTAFDGKLQVFASSNVGGIPAGYNLNILRAPDDATLSKIHFAKPFLGFLYVAAEFSDGSIFHFWLQSTATWAASTTYTVNALVEPITPNSFRFRATRASNAFPAWTPGAERAVGDKIEPTVYNGFYFEIVTVFGTNSLSGDVEPDWNDVTEGQLIDENVDGTAAQAAPLPPVPPDENVLPEAEEERYGDDD